MIRYVVFLFCWFFIGVCAVVAQAPISPRNDSLKSAVSLWFKAAGGTDNQISDSRLQLGVNMGISATARDFPAIPRDTVVSMDTDSHWVALPIDCDRVEMVFRKARGDTMWVPLTVIDQDSVQWFALTNSQHVHETENVGSPSYAYQWGQKLFTHPIMSSTSKHGIDFRVFYYASGSQLDADADTTLILPEYREYIVTYGIAKINEMLNLLGDASYFTGAYESDATKTKRAVSYQEVTEK